MNNDIIPVDDNLQEWIDSEFEVDGERGAPIEEYVGGGADVVPSVVNAVRYLKMKIELCKQEKRRVDHIKSVLENKLKRAEDWIRFNMQAADLKRVEFGTIRVTLRKPSYQVHIVDEDAVPAQYKENRIEVYVNKKAILDDVKRTGEIPDGVDIVPGVEGVVIK